jgi:hypothetical protein
MDLLRIAARVAVTAGRTLDFVVDEGYRRKAEQAVMELVDVYSTWHASLYGEAKDQAGNFLEGRNAYATADEAYEQTTGESIQFPRDGDGDEGVIHEGEHLLMDSDWLIRNVGGDQTTKNLADAFLDEVAISRLSLSDHISSTRRIAEGLITLMESRKLLKKHDVQGFFDVVESVSPGHSERKKAWSSAVRRTRGSKGSGLFDVAQQFTEGLMSTLSVERDPISQEVEEIMRKFYSRIFVISRRNLKAVKDFIREKESDPAWKAANESGVDAEVRRLVEDGFTEEEARSSLR